MGGVGNGEMPHNCPPGHSNVGDESIRTRMEAQVRPRPPSILSIRLRVVFVPDRGRGASIAKTNLCRAPRGSGGRTAGGMPPLPPPWPESDWTSQSESRAMLALELASFHVALHLHACMQNANALHHTPPARCRCDVARHLARF